MTDFNQDNELIPSADLIQNHGIGWTEVDAEKIFNEFKKVGEGIVRNFVNSGCLKPDYKVLDVGCGLGRLARPMTNILSNQGEYWGFDINKDSIDWCKEKYSKYQNENFDLANVFSKFYNPDTNLEANKYKFIYRDDYFDFVYLTSVFTHMFIEDVDNYISEIARVLKPGGKCWITFLLLNSESLDNINRGISKVNLRFKMNGGLIADKNMPERVVGLPENLILEIYEKYGFKINEPILYGSWCGREGMRGRQDVIIATKK